MTVLSYTNAFPGAAFPQHKSGQTKTVQSYLYPGAVRPKQTGPSVLSWTNAFPNMAFPQHKSGQTTTVQDYLYPGAVQPLQPLTAVPQAFSILSNIVTVTEVVTY